MLWHPNICESLDELKKDSQKFYFYVQRLLRVRQEENVASSNFTNIASNMMIIGGDAKG